MCVHASKCRMRAHHFRVVACVQGGAFESIFSPASSARSKEMRSILPLRAAYHTDDSVEAGRSRHVKKSFVLSFPSEKKIALVMFMRQPR